MQKNSVTVVLALLAMLACPAAIADGLIANGHVNGPYTVLTLTKEQISSLAHGKDKITLTDSQRKSLTCLPDSGSVRELLVLPVTTQTCTCELVNVAVRTNANSIEVADFQLGPNRDEEYKDPTLWDKRRKEQEAAEKIEASNLKKSEEASLNLKGIAEKNLESKNAIGYFQAALKINPNYKWARRNLASAYYGLGYTLLYNKPDFEQAAHYLELALNTADPTDLVFIESMKPVLRIAKAHSARKSAR
jgi:hypothetical protein